MLAACYPKAAHVWPVVAVVLASLLRASAVAAWVVSEHIDITARALEQIDAAKPAAQKAVLAEIQTGLHLCASGGDSLCPTLATLPALAADHSCSPGELRRMVDAASTDQDHWIHHVLRVADETRASLLSAGHDRSKREDIRRRMHLALQGADPDYLARALLDYSHFQVTREAGTRVLSDYLAVAFAPTSQANATASYANYHVVAVRFAAAAQRTTNPTERLESLSRAFLAEAFALHFLEDSFSAGHFVGHWGDAPTRLGTHDFYSGEGIEASQWQDQTRTFVAHGDAFLSDFEADRAATVVAASLSEVLEAATDADVADRLLTAFVGVFGEGEYDSCRRTDVPIGLSSLASSNAIDAIVGAEPVPSARYPAVARIRAEKGFFFGGAATAASSYEISSRTIGTEIRVAVRAGFGASSVVDDPLNTQAFLDLGFLGQYTSREGRRMSLTGYTARLRAPGYVSLADGIIAVLLADTLEGKCPFCLGWGTVAASGGLWSLWRSYPLVGSFAVQFSALRDVTFNWFRHEPEVGQSRLEILTPVITARSFVPIAGEKWSQSTDIYLDMGPSFTFGTGRDPRVGFFASLAMASRVFP